MSKLAATTHMTMRRIAFSISSLPTTLCTSSDRDQRQSAFIFPCRGAEVKDKARRHHAKHITPLRHLCVDESGSRRACSGLDRLRAIAARRGHLVQRALTSREPVAAALQTALRHGHEPS